MAKIVSSIVLIVLYVSSQTLAEDVGVKSRKLCEEHNVLKSPRTRRVVGGSDSELKEFPHMVALAHRSDNKLEFFCAGTLISDKYVLTSPICFKRGVDVARFGSNDLQSEEGVQEIEVERVIAHPKYNDSINDIGLVELKSAVKFTDFVKPACLNTEKLSASERTYLITGWGDHHKVGTKLQKAEVKEVEFDKCVEAYKTKLDIVDEDHICAREDGVDTCIGDSGAPLQMKNPDYVSAYDVHGVTSYGPVPCGKSSKPSTYTRVSNHIAWIESIIF
ncbi:PREDICTED: serine protease easter-like [Nicrophorus vespilloides]|uniref:Serine protease easter-like n=1 Tax=Nicrophorus vespilloides TaxID=110193 RepID=A0ABM1MS02_NICVS|nr:PREDICTED: serine protease easter-like [Nicrophorus vespilloides]